ncbi:ImmA/IrrE family metallo-endopeptidase [bacterium]|nr:ImmA/IrrE family metallo-endopeptidase [bacterium]
MQKDFFGDRLRQLRLINDKSLQNVGDAIATTKQYIQQLETGLQKPSDFMLQVLADYFHVNTRFFTSVYNKIQEEECFFRKVKSTPTNIKEKAESYTSLFEEYIRFLDEEEFDLPQSLFLKNKVDYKKLNREDIDKLADDFRKNCGLDDETPIENMTKVLENSGAIVTYFNDLSEKVDAFSINRTRPIIVRNDKKDNGCRLRFDLAHECGHLVLHDENDSDDEIEEQANNFASSLLLPRKGFFKEFYELFTSKNINWRKLIELKLRWKVSCAAIIHRAYDLNIIDTVRYRSAYIYLRKTGQTKKEWGDEKIEIENSSLLQDMTCELINNSVDDIICFLEQKGWSIDLFEKILPFDISKLREKMAQSENIIHLRF